MKSRQIMLVAAALGFITVAPARAQMHHPADHKGMSPAQSWSTHVMAQVFPILTAGDPFDTESQLNDRETYLTQPAIMVGMRSPGSLFSFDFTVDLEQLPEPGRRPVGRAVDLGWEGLRAVRHRGPDEPAGREVPDQPPSLPDPGAVARQRDLRARRRMDR